ncbi:MAG: glycosyltransferase family 2 protein [Patescibacteria group bacterium]
MNNRKRVAIAIITYNSADKLPDCLASIARQDYPAELVDLIIVDNNSTDNSLELAIKSPISARIIRNSINSGFAAANNQAYELARELKDDYLALLNDDTIVDPAWLSRLIDLAESDAKIAAVQAKLLLWPEQDLINSYGNALTFLGFGYCNDYRQKDKAGEPFEVPYPSGGAAVIKLSALAEIGLFDAELFMYHEDVDLGWRLRLSGYKVMLEPRAVVYHKYSFAKAAYKYYYMERNRLAVVLKNFRWPTLLLLCPAFKLMELGLCFYAVKNGWWREKLRGYFWVIKNWRHLAVERRKIQKLRRVGDREILSLFSAAIKFQDVDNQILIKLVNPLMSGYFWLIKRIIFW